MERLTHSKQKAVPEKETLQLKATNATEVFSIIQYNQDHYSLEICYSDLLLY